ncbi:MAG: thiamine ABC transporter substrate-binding protein [Bdellovibrio sp.]|jgi:thiamine transport system substrate-binding protein
MKHFLSFLVVIFAVLFLALFVKNSRDPSKETKPVLRVFASSSFIAQWGPGPWLRTQFEQTCHCRVEFFDGADSTILMQRLKSEARVGADIVLGFDQFDLEMATAGINWKPISVQGLDFEDEAKPALAQPEFVPYDFGVMSFVFRKSELAQFPKNLDDFLKPEWKGQISMQDPRTSSPGLQFLLWLIDIRGEEGAWEYLKRFNAQVKAYSTSWSMAYGLFTKAQAMTVFSYTTSPVYHKVEEKNLDVVAVELNEGHPLQFEFMGIPANCQQCDLAQKFAELVLSKEGQKVVMEKNYMFPVIKAVKDGTIFGEIPPYKLRPYEIVPSQAERERLLRKWSALRRME